MRSGALAGIAGMLSACNLSVINQTLPKEMNLLLSHHLSSAEPASSEEKEGTSAIIGIVMIQAIINGLTMMGASAYSYTIFRGIIIFIAVMVDSIKFSGEIR